MQPVSASAEMRGRQQMSQCLPQRHRLHHRATLCRWLLCRTHEIGADGHLKNTKMAGSRRTAVMCRTMVPLWAKPRPKGNTDAPLESSSGPDVSIDGAPDAASEGGGLEASTIDSQADAGDASSAEAAFGDADTRDADAAASLDAQADAPHHSTAPWHLWMLEQTTGRIYGYAPSQLTSTNGDEPGNRSHPLGSHLLFPVRRTGQHLGPPHQCDRGRQVRRSRARHFKLAPPRRQIHRKRRR